MAAMETSNSKMLNFTVHKYSSYYSSYSPEKVLENNPSDQSSRWSTESNNPPQYLILKLERCALLDSIKFGKFEKHHVCNMKKFKIFAGIKENNMVQIYEGGLKNDHVPELFSIKYEVNGYQIPCKYLKILPLLSWGPSFNFSVWYIELFGRDEPEVVLPILKHFHQYRENEALRLCMKHLRERGAEMLPLYNALQESTGVILEAPMLTRLHNTLVINADYLETEKIMSEAIEGGYLDEYLNTREYSPCWRRITSLHNNEELNQPGMRGGHQMCIDILTETIYLFGGWDGTQDLSDFWQYHIPTNQWSRISSNTEAEGGPTARSCHKMCLDPDRKQIFLLGRYLDTQFRSPDKVKSDFYVYDIESNTWTLISEDTASVGGPALIFDHQMCIDINTSNIYVYGGRILTPSTNAGSIDDGRSNSTGSNSTTSSSNDTLFSGLFSFHIPTCTWTKVCDDSEMPIHLTQSGPVLRSRVGHSMLFHPVLRKLFVFAGQRSKEYLNDFFTYNVDTHEVKVIWECKDVEANKEPANFNNFPATGYTQRATIDYNLNEIYVLSGLSKDKEKRDDNVQNAFWVYNISQNKWACVYRNENTGEQYWDKMQFMEPCPRFAHQLVYNPVNKTHYLFGGNPGKPKPPKLRLDDFWQLRLYRPSKDLLLRNIQRLIRKYKYKELAVDNSLDALVYLQTSLAEITDHSDSQQTKESLTKELFKNQSEFDEDSETLNMGPFYNRSRLFDELSAFFPQSLSQPRENLVDLIPF